MQQQQQQQMMNAQFGGAKLKKKKKKTTASSTGRTQSVGKKKLRQPVMGDNENIDPNLLQ